MTNSVKNAINKRDQLFRLWVCNPTDENHNLLKKQRNNFTRIICKAKKEKNTVFRHIKFLKCKQLQ